jgi:hypothetical protein
MDTSNDREAIRQELRKLGTFNSTIDLTLQNSTGGLAAGSTNSHQGLIAADTELRSKLMTNGTDTVSSLNRLIVPSSDNSKTTYCLIVEHNKMFTDHV